MAQYGQPLGVLVAIALIWTFDPKRRGRIVLLAAALAAAGLGADLLKSLAGRVRPIDAEFQTVFHGPVRNLADTRTQSFPSGHTATAFALSCVLASMYPKIRPLLWFLAMGVAVNRILTVRHFPTDVIAGAWFGYFAAVWTSSSTRLAAIVDRCNARWASARLRPVAWKPRELYRFWTRRVAASPWLLAAACLAMYWAGNGDYGLWDRDEPRFATATREMIARGDWIVPTFNAELRPDKPILIYWLQAIAYWAFHDGPFAARFWSGVGGAAACLTTWRLGSSMFGPRVGVVSAWILALSPMLVVESKLATVDAVLLALLAAGHWAMWRVYCGDPSARVRLLFWTAVGLALLTKGPVALAVLAGTALAFSALRREFQWLRRLNWTWGPALALAIVLPWTVAVEIATGGEFLRRAVGRHVLTRAVEPMENHSGFPGYYVASLFALMAPWAFLLPWAVWTHRRRWRVDPRLAYLFAWAGASLILFEIVRTKLVHYYLPAYPALATILAAALAGRFGDASLGLRTVPRRVVGWGAIAASGLLVAAIAAACALLPRDVGAPAAMAALIAGLGGLVVGRCVLDGRWRLAFQVHAAVGVVFVLAVGAQLLPRIHRQQVIVDVANELRSIRKGGGAVALWLYRDPSLVYQLGEVVPVVDVQSHEAPFPESLALARRVGRFVVPLTDEQLGRMQSDPSLNVAVRESVRRWDVAGLRVRTVHLAEVGARDDVARQPVETGAR
jgi:4-amino-4-deoxy-L-arabinose transferase-like glycosyltransferase/membrane-associated phospholipid phosphatase